MATRHISVRHIARFLDQLRQINWTSRPTQTAPTRVNIKPTQTPCSANAPRSRGLQQLGVLMGVMMSIALGGVTSQAEPFVTQGIGTSSCASIATDINPSLGLANPFNLMLYAWVQGYVSAANLALLGNEAEHLDAGALNEATVLNFVLGFCKTNPDKKPIAAIDELIRTSAKVKANAAATGTTPWHE